MLLLHYIKNRGFNIHSKKELNQKHFCGTEGKCQKLLSCKTCSLSTPCTCPAQPFVFMVTQALASPFSPLQPRCVSPAGTLCPAHCRSGAGACAAAPWQTLVCASGRRAEDRMEGRGSDGKASLRRAQRSLLFLFPLRFAVSKRSAPRQAFASGCGEYFGAMLVASPEPQQFRECACSALSHPVFAAAGAVCLLPGSCVHSDC